MTRPMTRGLTAAALIAALGVANAACGAGQRFAAVGDRPHVRPAAGPARRQEPVEGPSTDQVLKIERLEAQIRQLTGTVEQLQYRNQQLENQLRASGGPVAQPAPPPPVTRPAMQGTGIQAAPLPPPLVPAARCTAVGHAAPPPPPSVTGRRSDVFDPSQNPNAPGVPRPLGSMPNEPPPLVTADPPVGAPGGRGAGGPLDLSTMAAIPGVAPGAPSDGPLPPPPSRNLSGTGAAVASVAPPTESPKDTYDLGYGYMLRKDYALAEDTSMLPEEVPDRPPRRGSRVLAGGELVPAPAL